MKYEDLFNITWATGTSEADPSVTLFSITGNPVSIVDGVEANFPIQSAWFQATTAAEIESKKKVLFRDVLISCILWYHIGKEAYDEKCNDQSQTGVSIKTFPFLDNYALHYYPEGLLT
jgi:hypothetical protein